MRTVHRQSKGRIRQYLSPQPPAVFLMRTFAGFPGPRGPIGRPGLPGRAGLIGFFGLPGAPGLNGAPGNCPPLTSPANLPLYSDQLIEIGARWMNRLQASPMLRPCQWSRLLP